MLRGTVERMLWFRRPDGELVRDLPPTKLIMPYIMRGRNESAFYFEQQISLYKTDAYIRAFNDAHPSTPIGVQHILMRRDRDRDDPVPHLEPVRRRRPPLPAVGDLVLVLGEAEPEGGIAAHRAEAPLRSRRALRRHGRRHAPATARGSLRRWSHPLRHRDRPHHEASESRPATGDGDRSLRRRASGCSRGSSSTAIRCTPVPSSPTSGASARTPVGTICTNTGRSASSACSGGPPPSPAPPPAGPTGAARWRCGGPTTNGSKTAWWPGTVSGCASRSSRIR